MTEIELKSLDSDQLLKIILKLHSEIERLKQEIARLRHNQSRNLDPDINSVLMLSHRLFLQLIGLFEDSTADTTVHKSKTLIGDSQITQKLFKILNKLNLQTDVPPLPVDKDSQTEVDSETIELL